MSHDDLERVQSDLATIKAACAEQAAPTEEIMAGLVLAGFGVLLAAGAWLVPLQWLRWTALLFVASGTAVYIPWKRRIMRSDAPRRRLEKQEFIFFGVAGVLAVAYLCWRWLVMGEGSKAPQTSGGAVMFLVGAMICGHCLAHPGRWFYLGQAVSLMVGGLLLPLASNPQWVIMIVGAMTTVCGATTSLALAWHARKERDLHAGH